MRRRPPRSTRTDTLFPYTTLFRSTRSWAADWLEGLLAHEGIEPDPGIKDALWSALGSLASAPACERTLSGLCALLQENRLRQALAPHVLGGPHGRLLDAECGSPGEGVVRGNGGASCREGVCQDVEMSVVAGSIK